jgi:hypothetical protein
LLSEKAVLSDLTVDNVPFAAASVSRTAMEKSSLTA